MLLVVVKQGGLILKFKFTHLYWLVIFLLLLTNIAFFLENEKNKHYAFELRDSWRDYRIDLVKQVCDVNLLAWKEDYDRNLLKNTFSNDWNFFYSKSG